MPAAAELPEAPLRPKPSPPPARDSFEDPRVIEERARGRLKAARPLTNMARIGEESGRLAAVMEQVGPFYKEKMEALAPKATRMLEPIVIMFMGTSIPGIMLAIDMPMFEMAGEVK